MLVLTNLVVIELRSDDFSCYTVVWKIWAYRNEGFLALEYEQKRNKRLPLSVKIPAICCCSPGFSTTSDPILCCAICNVTKIFSVKYACTTKLNQEKLALNFHFGGTLHFSQHLQQCRLSGSRARTQLYHLLWSSKPQLPICSLVPSLRLVKMKRR